VVQASNNEAATPARPPRAEVPDVQEESLEPDVATAPPAGDDSLAEPPADDAAAVPPVDASGVVPADASGEEAEEPQEVASQTAWRTFTTAPPRLAARP